MSISVFHTDSFGYQKITFFWLGKETTPMLMDQKTSVPPYSKKIMNKHFFLVGLCVEYSVT